MSKKEEFARWVASFSGFDGGDIGSPSSPSVWVCGIEWAGDQISYEWLKKELQAGAVSSPPAGYEKPEDNLDYVYNRNAMKLLAAIDGLPASDYEKFALNEKPFVEGGKGYFKLNLYPLPFKDTSPERWAIWLHELTGISEKHEYLDLCRTHRFPFLREIKKAHKPKLVICFGKSYKDDFISAFGGDEETVHEETIETRDLYWFSSDEGIVAICPFPTSQYGLNSDELLEAFGKRIRELVDNMDR